MSTAAASSASMVRDLLREDPDLYYDRPKLYLKICDLWNDRNPGIPLPRPGSIDRQASRERAFASRWRSIRGTRTDQ